VGRCESELELESELLQLQVVRRKKQPMFSGLRNWPLFLGLSFPYRFSERTQQPVIDAAK